MEGVVKVGYLLSAPWLPLVPWRLRSSAVRVRRQRRRPVAVRLSRTCGRRGGTWRASGSRGLENLEFKSVGALETRESERRKFKVLGRAGRRLRQQWPMPPSRRTIPCNGMEPGKWGSLMAQSGANPPERLRCRGSFCPGSSVPPAILDPCRATCSSILKYEFQFGCERVSFLASNAITTQHITSEQKPSMLLQYYQFAI